MHSNRRYEYRILADIVVKDFSLEPSRGQKVQGAIRELSASGCRLEANVDLEVGQKLQLTFALNPEIALRGVTAQVVRRLSQRSRRAVGLTFLGLSESDQYKIREYVVWREAREHYRESKS